MEQDQPNSMSMIFPPKRLQDLFRESIENLNFTEEQIRQWLQDIIQDLKERHVGYRLPPHDPIMEKVLDEVNYQLETKMVHVYTMVPIQGLDVKMLYDTKIKITEDISVRKIANWEWQRYFHMLDVGNNNLPSIVFEWTRNVNIDALQGSYSNTNIRVDQLYWDHHICIEQLQAFSACATSMFHFDSAVNAFDRAITDIRIKQAVFHGIIVV